MTSKMQDQVLNTTDYTNQIRSFREEDRAAVVEVMNAGRLPHRYYSVDEWIRNDARRTGQEVYIRLVVGEPAVAYMQVQDMNTTVWRTPGICEMYLVVAPEYRRRGIGSLLYQRALAFAHERNVERLLTWYDEYSQDEPAITFLQQRGFVEQERGQPSYLDLDRFDFSRFTGIIEKVQQQGVRLFSYAEVPDTTENRRKLYDLINEVGKDMPRLDPAPFVVPPFEQFVKFQFERPDWLPEANMLAEADGQWVGISQLMHKPGTTIGNTWLTGILREYRGRDIATALKLRVFEIARQRGISIIDTDNHTENAPMLAINRKFGFVPEPPTVYCNKVLRESTEKEHSHDH